MSWEREHLHDVRDDCESTVLLDNGAVRAVEVCMICDQDRDKCGCLSEKEPEWVRQQRPAPRYRP